MTTEVARGTFHKLGSRDLFGTSWKQRVFVLSSDGILSYYEIGPNGARKGSVDVKGVVVERHKAPWAALRNPTGQEVGLRLSRHADPQRKVLELVMDDEDAASNLIHGLSSIRTKVGVFESVAPLATSAAESSEDAPLDPEKTQRNETAEGLDSQPNVPVSVEKPVVHGEKNSSLVINATSSLGKVASFCWALLCVVVAFYPSPMLIFLFSLLTGCFVKILRWGSEGFFQFGGKRKLE